MKRILFLLLIVVFCGCATHAVIETPAVTKVYSKAFENKSIGYEILYSQPEPGILSEGKQMPLVPIEQAKLSVGSAKTLRKLPDYIYQQLPSAVKCADHSNCDYKLLVEMVAHNKRGPAYSDYEAGKSFAKGMATFGFASSEFDIIADFDVKYILLKEGKDVFKKDYKVKESVDHQKGKFDSFNSLDEYTSQLFEKHLMLTLNNFFKEAEKAL